MKRYLKLLTVLLFLTPNLTAQEARVTEFRFEVPALVLTGVNFDIEVSAVDAAGEIVADYSGTPVVEGLTVKGAEGLSYAFVDGKLSLTDLVVADSGRTEIKFSDGAVRSNVELRAIPGILSILPPLIAIALALIFRQVVVALYSGIWLGAIFLYDYRIVGGFFRALDHFLINALTEKSHVQIIVFSLLFGGMVGVITRSGGAKGVANLITKWATTPRGGQLAAWGMAFFLFFDDYANVLVRGNLMRPITDKLRVSREKLSFLVDTGAATVASIFIISTWIGYEVGLIEQGLKMIGSTESAYTMFIRTIPYRFYPILALILAFIISWTGRELGPMLEAERRARFEGKVLRDGAKPATDLSASAGLSSEDVPARWYNGFLPVVTILVVGLLGLYLTGTDALRAQGATTWGVGEIMSNADSYQALLWASLAGCMMAIFLAVGQRILSLSDALDSWVEGLKSMMLAMLILVMAWALGSVTEELHTAGYLVQILRGVLSPFWLPALTFIVAATVAFSTGTSWATMAIMMPLVIPLGHTLGVDAALTPGELDRILLGVISSVLAGAVFGDHCSPISDTTILSSMSSACDHIDHVRTQLPYALIAAVVGVCVGDIPTAYGMSPWISISVGTAALVGVMYAFGKKISDGAPDAATER